MFVLFACLFWPFSKFGFFLKWETNLTPKQSNSIFLVNSSKVKQAAIFQKSVAILTKTEDRPNCGCISNTFSTQNYVLWKKLWLFGLFFGDKGDYIDVWMIKITIEINQIDMDVCFPGFASFKSGYH